MDKIRWGVLGTANIAVEKVIPAIKEDKHSLIEAISSRSKEKAERTAKKLSIPKFYGSYDELLDDSDIDAVYIPLPNHLHLPWSVKALEAGKHVLCEKPIAMDADETEKLLSVAEKYPDLKVMEAFMYRHHPQWEKAYELVHNREIGNLQTIEIFFSYYNTDPDDIRNQVETGGGALMDIGCYAISLSRFLFEREPTDIHSRMKKDDDLKVDYLTSAIMDFQKGTATFTCSTQSSSHQHVHICGTEGRIFMPLPFSPPIDRSSRIFLHSGSDEKVMKFPVENQFVIQSELFAKAILYDREVPISLEDSHANMKAIDMVRRSAISREH
ncbi:Gfo/Idh/MocA family protein [Fodinibius sp. AD559]|uniref:Gfo/Idh/MocA family protein n=1 Tax=Fodinibius sp. AD559 TaxID=3424179 RepID=UPI0040468BBF